jgi:hypothetical protein
VLIESVSAIRADRLGCRGSHRAREGPEERPGGSLDGPAFRSTGPPRVRLRPGGAPVPLQSPDVPAGRAGSSRSMHPPPPSSLPYVEGTPSLPYRATAVAGFVESDPHTRSGPARLRRPRSGCATRCGGTPASSPRCSPPEGGPRCRTGARESPRRGNSPRGSVQGPGEGRRRRR